jgi:hypothetical protein
VLTSFALATGKSFAHASCTCSTPAGGTEPTITLEECPLSYFSKSFDPVNLTILVAAGHYIYSLFPDYQGDGNIDSGYDANKKDDRNEKAMVRLVSVLVLAPHTIMS